MRTLIITIVVLLFLDCGGKNEPAPKATQPPATSETTILLAPAESAKPATSETAQAATSTSKQKPPAQLPKLWDFFATWCPPCKRQAPIVEEIAREFEGKIEVRSIDTDKEPELARKFNIQAIPTLVFLGADGKELSRNVGLMSKEEIVARFKEHGFIE